MPDRPSHSEAVRRTPGVGLALALAVGAVVVACGTAGPVDEAAWRRERGLLEDWQLREYARPRAARGTDDYVSLFGNEVLRRAPLLVTGAISGIQSGITRFQVATLTVGEVLYARDRDPESRTVTVYSPTPGFFDNCRGERFFALAPWRAGGQYSVAATFTLDAGIRQAQLDAVRDLIAIEAIEDRTERRAQLRARAFAGLTAKEDWVTNVWATQLAGLAERAPGAFARGDLVRLERTILAFARNRPSAGATIYGLKRTIQQLVAKRYKHVWVGRLISDTPTPSRRAAANAIRGFAVAGYRDAWTFLDRTVLTTLIELETDTEVLSALSEAENSLREILKTPVTVHPLKARMRTSGAPSSSHGRSAAGSGATPPER